MNNGLIPSTYTVTVDITPTAMGFIAVAIILFFVAKRYFA